MNDIFKNIKLNVACIIKNCFVDISHLFSLITICFESAIEKTKYIEICQLRIIYIFLKYTFV